MTIPTNTDITRALQVDGELRGWIQPCDPETAPAVAEKELTSLGVDVGVWDAKTGEFKYCIVSQEAMRNLDPYWGRYIWGLE